MNSLCRRLGLVFLLVALTGIAACNCGDDDDDDDSGGNAYSCADLCAKAAECDPSCVPADDCETYCLDNFSTSELECTALSSCTQFEQCLCASDDDADDDSVDDDSADDDSADDDVMVPEELGTDDGSAESDVGLWNNGRMVKALTPSEYPFHLTGVSLWLTRLGVTATNYEVVVYNDPTGGSPDDATLAWSSGALTEMPPMWPDGQWYEFNVAETGGAGDPVESPGTWTVGLAFYDPSNTVLIGGDEDFPGGNDDQCFAIMNDGWVPVSDMGVAGTLMIRAEGYYYE